MLSRWVFKGFISAAFYTLHPFSPPSVWHRGRGPAREAQTLAMNIIRTAIIFPPKLIWQSHLATYKWAFLETEMRRDKALLANKSIILSSGSGSDNVLPMHDTQPLEVQRRHEQEAGFNLQACSTNIFQCIWFKSPDSGFQRTVLFMC